MALEEELAQQQQQQQQQQLQERAKVGSVANKIEISSLLMSNKASLARRSNQEQEESEETNNNNIAASGAVEATCNEAREMEKGAEVTMRSAAESGQVAGDGEEGEGDICAASSGQVATLDGNASVCAAGDEKLKGQHTVIECDEETNNKSSDALLDTEINLEEKLRDRRELTSNSSLNRTHSQKRKQEDSREQITNNCHLSQKQQQEDCSKQQTPTASATLLHQDFCKRRRLSYLQSLLLRKWPYLAIGICIMSSLLFGVLLSTLTVYLLHGVTDCSGLVSPLLGPHDHLRRPGEFDTSPIELSAALTASSGDISSRHYAALSALSPESSTNQADKPHFQRLPQSLWPVHYDLFVQPYIAEPFNFTGKVLIQIKCKEPTDNITLHTLDLELNEKSLKIKGINNATFAPKVVGLSQDKQLQYSIIKLDAELEVGKEYVLDIDFVGYLNDDLAGFYKIKYERQNSSETIWIAATQFQATDARRAFPCFDEPHYKATFSIQIKHWKNMTALSNMPIVDRLDSTDGLWVTDTFSKSHKMSTYLVAFAVTNFESRSEGNISVWTRPGFASTAEYALKIAGKILRHYEDFFGIEYPLPKMDMIALPDFNAGAMENWGLITYRETAMLYDENISSMSNKQRVAVVVAHELAHQWFGNLVTPKWWDDLWLNEGFASYVEYIGVDFVEPTWRMLDQFVVEEVQNVFKVDALTSSHQISIPVNNPEEISEIFDHISYAKGASVIRMMNHFLTEDVFKAGLRRYLRALQYGNAEQSDLWNHLTEAQRLAGKSSEGCVDVEKVMHSWTLQTGYPLVTLTRQYGNSKRAKLEQRRYQPYKWQQANNGTKTLNGSLALVTPSESAQRWEVPITFTWKSEQDWQPRTRVWLHQNDSGPTELNSKLLPSSDDDWMLLNIQQVGYYRVNYDIKNWRLLIEQLISDHEKIGVTNRAQILDDMFELARSSVIDYRFAMEATKYLKSERDYLPWDTVLMSFSYIDDMLQRTPIYGYWKDYIADLIAPYYGRYKDNEWTTRNKITSLNGSSIEVPEVATNDVLEQYNQVNAVAYACQVDDHCIQKAKSLFAEWKQTNRNTIKPVLRYTIYCTAIENGSKEDWDFLWKAYEREQNASERDRLLRALSCSKEIWILSRYLEWTFNKTKPIRRQDGAFVFRVIAKNNYGRDVAFNFMREKWSIIKDYYGKTSFSLGNLIRSISTSMNTQTELNQLLNFYETIKNDVGTGKRSFQIAIEEVESNVLWRNRNYKLLEDWIHEERSKKVKTVG